MSMSSRGQKQWEDALQSERLEQAKQVYARLQALPWGELTRVDRAIMGVLGYWTLDSDEPLASLVEYDLSEEATDAQ